MNVLFHENHTVHLPGSELTGSFPGSSQFPPATLPTSHRHPPSLRPVSALALPFCHASFLRAVCPPSFSANGPLSCFIRRSPCSSYCLHIPLISSRSPASAPTRHHILSPLVWCFPFRIATFLFRSALLLLPSSSLFHHFSTKFAGPLDWWSRCVSTRLVLPVPFSFSPLRPGVAPHLRPILPLSLTFPHSGSLVLLHPIVH